MNVDCKYMVTPTLIHLMCMYTVYTVTGQLKQLKQLKDMISVARLPNRLLITGDIPARRPAPGVRRPPNCQPPGHCSTAARLRNKETGLLCLMNITRASSGGH